jgi:hypothetical protein
MIMALSVAGVDPVNTMHGKPKPHQTVSQVGRTW